MTAAPIDLPTLARHARAFLSRRDSRAPLVTYQALAAALGMVPPGMIQAVAAVLEHLMREDAAASRPMIAALVISRTDRIPRRGFFDLAVALGRFPPDPDSHPEAWQAEVAAVLGGRMEG